VALALKFSSFDKQQVDSGGFFPAVLVDQHRREDPAATVYGRALSLRA
jgi:hypothetical protein